MNQEVVSFDTETETLNSLETKLIGISFSWEKYTGYFISFNYVYSILHMKSKETHTPFLQTLSSKNNGFEKIVVSKK